MSRNRTPMEKTEVTVAAVYLRVSTDEQTERGTILTQREFALRYCELHGIRIHEQYADEGVSGTVPLGDRPEGARLLADARAGKFGMVLLYRLDRLGRNPRHILNAVEELTNDGVVVRSMTESFDTETPAGKLMLGTLASFAGFERDSIVERSVAGTNRLAREGVWVGGIAPFGYQVVESDKRTRLTVNEEPLPGCEWSEAEVIRHIYRWLADEGRSCIWIAEQLNVMGIPPAYVRDDRKVTRNKRQERTAGVWRAGRVRNMAVSTVYMGVHEFGKRSTRRRETIRRDVPAIVVAETWYRAQETLRKNQLFSQRNAKHQYLLRGMLKCGLCGLNYIGTSYPLKARENGKDVPTGKERWYYVCNGKHGAGRGPYGERGERCPSKSVSGDVEEFVWHDVETFLRDPQPVIAQLEERMRGEIDEAGHLNADIERLAKQRTSKSQERDRVVTLYRRNVIDDATLDTQLAAIAAEEETLKREETELQQRVSTATQMRQQLRTAEALLHDLNRRLDEPLTWETKRELIETLVTEIVVKTPEGTDQPLREKRAEIVVRYRFTQPAPHTDKDSLPQPT